MLTPGMKQYMDIKNENPDCIVLFRMGDFYETFYEDAKTVAKELQIVLTTRGKGDSQAPLAGIPYHALTQYLTKLVQNGHKVAIVEQLEDPKQAKGLVKRGLVRIVTQGTLLEDSMLESSSHNYLAVIYPEKKKDVYHYGISFCDVSTGDFFLLEAEGDVAFLGELQKIHPKEIVIPMSMEQSQLASELISNGFIVRTIEDRFFLFDKAKQTILEHFNVADIGGFGISGKTLAISSSGAMIEYLYQTQLTKKVYLKSPRTYSIHDYMVLDSVTQKNLELIEGTVAKSASLFHTIDMTKTAMGKRMLKRWILQPLIDVQKIKTRQNAIELLYNDVIATQDIASLLAEIVDLERINSRILYRIASPKDLIAFAQSLLIVPKLKERVAQLENVYFSDIKNVGATNEITQDILTALIEDPPSLIRDGKFIKEGYSEKLDELRTLAKSAKEYLLAFEEKERERTGIKNLKVSYSRAFGYFIEISKANLSKAPKEYIRKQTLTNCERFITEELKEKESIILTAEEKSKALEQELYMSLLDRLSQYSQTIYTIIEKISNLDCICSLAQIALKQSYYRPEITDDRSIKIEDGRHPVIETIKVGSFVSNSCTLHKDARTHIITGPNMAGKSTYLRQIALITLLAQMGSFVPAKNASIGVVDRIFTRVGANDNAAAGMSTFMVEMTETANILNNATDKSLVILDEVGRGTSTYDGFAIAWAITQYLHERNSFTLFATHYHQLNTMAEQFSGIKNYNISVLEENDTVEFLHKIVEGGTDKSYGIYTAKIAGVPQEALDIAATIMDSIEKEDQLAMDIPVQKEKKIEKEVESTPNIQDIRQKTLGQILK